MRPDWCGLVGWVLSCKAKCHWFYSWSVHMPGLCARGNQSMFLSHINVSLPLSLPACLPLSLKINK